MTALLHRAVAVPGPGTVPAPRRALRSLAPWLFPAAAAVWALHSTGTPARLIAVYGAYFLLCVVLPGTLVHRALYGSRGNLPEDLGVGAATGLVVQLAGWALAAASGLQVLLPAWAGLVALIFLVVPRLRRHWRVAAGGADGRIADPLPAAWSWAVAAVLVLVALWAATVFRSWPLPPATAAYYPDLYYHLALVHEMTRSMPFQVPQLAGETLRYHYLSDADMAAASMITGIAPATVQLRLWLIPIVGTGVMVIAVLARAVSGRWWVGPVAAGLAFAGHVPRFGVPVEPTGGGLPVSLLSPSQTFVVPLFALLVLVAVDALRGRPMRWGWGFLPALAVACAGAKSSALPAFAAGVALAGLVLLWRLRRVPWAAAGLLAVAGFGMAVGLRLFAGGGAGTLEVQPLSVVRWMTPYVQTLGAHDGVTKGGLFPPGVASAGVAGRWFVAALVVWWVLMQAPRLIGLVLPPRRRPAGTGDPALWLVAGMLVAGTGAMWLFWHPSQSQIYFFAGVVPFGAVLTVWALADRVRRWPVPVAGVAAGALWSLLAPQADAPGGRAAGPWAWALWLPLLTTAAVTVIVAGAAWAIWGRRALRNLPVGLLAAVVGAGLASGAADTVRELSAPPPGQDPMRRVVTAAEMRAALWLDANAGDDDVVATNVHCMPMNAKVCDARAFWVAGLGGRRTLVESWAYTDAAVAANGAGGRKYFYQPAPDAAVYDLNERVFRYGDPADTARLRDEYGVRWLLADVRAGAVAPSLAAVATVRYTDGPATVYELR